MVRILHPTKTVLVPFAAASAGIIYYGTALEFLQDVMIVSEKFTAERGEGMEESKFDKGFTQMPNNLLNALINGKFTGVELRLILLIMRYSNGFMKPSAELSLGFLAREIGSNPCVVSRTLKKLINTKIIKVYYVNPETKVRAIMVNDNIGSWAINPNATHDPERREFTGKPGSLLPQNSPRMHNNMNTFSNIKEKIVLSPKIEKGFIKWLEYKDEKGEFYGRIPMATLAATIRAKAEKWGEDLVLELIDDCIAAEYKNIIWDKLKTLVSRKKWDTKNSSVSGSTRENFLSDYNHSVLEKLSRGIYDD